MKADGHNTGPGASALCLVEEALEREIVLVLYRHVKGTPRTPQIAMFTLVTVRLRLTTVN